MIAFTLCLFLCFGLLQPVRAGQVEEIPNPMETAGLYVQDSGSVLGAEYIELINGICQTLYEKTSTDLAVVTIQSLHGITIEEFSLRLFERFGLGEKGKDNGLLILFARDDREVRMEVGYGLEDRVTDADASRLLDEHAIPFFKEGLYGRGLFTTAKKTAEFISSTLGESLGIEEPGTLPAEPVPTANLADITRPIEKPGPITIALLYTAAIFGFIFFGFVFILLRMHTKKSKSAREKAARGQDSFLAIMWIAAVFGPIVLANVFGANIPLLLAAVAAPILSTVGMLKGINWLRRKASSYRANCLDCNREMNLLDDKADDDYLSIEEQAEEKAGGLEYEIWICPNCGTSRSIVVKRGKARKCPRCKRRTLKTFTKTMKAATKSSRGLLRILEKCKNPKCGYSKAREKKTPKISSHGSFSSSSRRSGYSSRRSSSSSSRSSRSSFGGGRSGGGGASKHW